MVVGAKQRDYCFASGPAVVMRNGREEMVDDMVTRDVMKEVRADDAKVPVDCCGRSSNESPAFGRVFRDVWVRMMEEGDHDNEVVDDTPWNNVEPEY